MKVLLLSAYAAQSHHYWQERLVDMFPDWDWQILALPPRYFSWRIRGNPLYWAFEEREVLERGYDLLIATSMVDLATLRGLVPAISGVPSMLYFHENQFAYPQDRQSHSLLEAQMVSLYAAIAAERIAFNSAHNANSFFSGCAALLQRLPDKVPRGVVESLRARASILPVPLSPKLGAGGGSSRWSQQEQDYPGRALRLLWVGRFEHDKGGDKLLRVLQELELTGLDFELAVIGQQFRSSPGSFEAVASEFKPRLVQFGYLESADDYGQYLQDADIVLSTALHEFQGLAVLEAVASGCVPVVPDRLVYPEIFPAAYRYPVDLVNPADEARAAAALIVELAGRLMQAARDLSVVERFSVEQLQPRYRATLQTLAGCGRDSPEAAI